MPPPIFYKNRICKDSCYQAEVGGSPQLKLLPLILKRPSIDAAPNSYKNPICKESWHQAEVGGFPQLKLSPLNFKGPSVNAAAHFFIRNLFVKTRPIKLRSGVLPD